MRSFSVEVPATTANLGPGFDTLGLALSIYNKVRFIPASVDSITASGPGSEKLPLDQSNLTYQAFRHSFEQLEQKMGKWRIEITCRIPLESGLGSSAAAILAGLVGGVAAGEAPCSLETILDWATSFEGHPDNVAPALYGGFTIAVRDRNGARATRLPLPRHPGLVIAIPPFSLATKKSRAVLPQQVSRTDAVYNLGQVTLLTSAMTTGRLEWLANALGDRLHEPYRAALVPGMEEVRTAAKEAGAWGVVLSGAGPALLALCPPEKTTEVVEAMNGVWEGSEVFPCSIDCRGTRVQFDDLHGIEGSR